MKLEHAGLRYNKGKERFDLVNADAYKRMVEILTLGAEKYAPRNWEKGMAWTNVIASLKRHLNAIEDGEDYDVETGKLHVDHLACNAHFLSAYYKIYPQGDDRNHAWYTNTKIGLDIDDVLASWLPSFCELNNMKVPDSWQFHRDLPGAFKMMREKGIDTDEGMENLPVLTNPEEIPFEPFAYITARSHCPKEAAERWLDKNGFPAAPVYQTNGKSKVDICKELGIEIFVDDNYHNFVELNKAGIFCYLFDRPHNQRYNVGHRRIKSLSEIG
jgi:hypothetical protein